MGELPVQRDQRVGVELTQADGGELRLVIPADGLVPCIVALTFLDRLIPCFASLKRPWPRYPLPRTGVVMHPDQTRTSV